jgi:NAD(P)H-hydrate epimerase
MIPLLSAEVMRECDARAVAKRGVEELVRAAGVAVGLEAHRMLGSCYGQRVAVIVGPGLNGADGRVASQWLSSRGAKVDIVEVATQPLELNGFDLVIDAAFGLGCSREYVAPRVAKGTLVLAVDLPSGVDADTGALLGSPLVADVTVALGAVKRAHVDGDASNYVGRLVFKSLDIETPLRDGVIEDADLDGFVHSSHDDHKWSHAVSVLAGSANMPGAAALVCSGALSAGASMVRLESRGKIAKLVRLPAEVVRYQGPQVDVRSKSVVAGPGLGIDASKWLRDRLRDVPMPLVLDADGLVADVVELGRDWVLTPHRREFERLSGSVLGSDRIDAVVAMAQSTGCVVLLKGPTTIISSPQGVIRIVKSGTPALATAGTGDVLGGMIGAALARGHEPIAAAALAAHLHGRAGAHLEVFDGASLLPRRVTYVLNELAQRPRSDSGRFL